jgi:hypothetical protein
MGVLAIGDGGNLTEVPADAAPYTTYGYPLSFDPSAKHLYRNRFYTKAIAELLKSPSEIERPG